MSGEQALDILTAAETALVEAESHIRGQYEGTTVYDRMMGDMQPVRDAINNADARLISAAPDLLAACIAFVEKCNAGQARSVASYNQMNAAIAKATGDGQ